MRFLRRHRQPLVYRTRHAWHEEIAVVDMTCPWGYRSPTLGSLSSHVRRAFAHWVRKIKCCPAAAAAHREARIERNIT